MVMVSCQKNQGYYTFKQEAFQGDTVVFNLNGKTYGGKTYIDKAVDGSGTYVINFILKSNPYRSDSIDNYLIKYELVQFISFSNIHLKEGIFYLGSESSIKLSYELLSGGDGVIDSFYIDDKHNSQIEIIKADRRKGTVLGYFDLNVLNKQGNRFHFKNGKFSVELSK